MQAWAVQRMQALVALATKVWEGQDTKVSEVLHIVALEVPLTKVSEALHIGALEVLHMTASEALVTQDLADLVIQVSVAVTVVQASVDVNSYMHSFA